MISTTINRISLYSDHVSLMIGAVLPPEITSEILQWAIAIMVGFWFRSFLSKPEEHGKRLSDLEKKIELNEQADKFRNDQLQEMKEFYKESREINKEILKALATKV